jgi:hypothetical protein
MTPRDHCTLTWIAEQYAVRFDHLQRLLSRHPGHTNAAQKPSPQGISASAVEQVLARWLQDPAWVEYRRFNRGPGWITVSPYGLEVIDAPYARHLLKESSTTHLYAINRVRLDIEARHPEWQWTSERTLRFQSLPRGRGMKIPHVPDGEVWLNQQQAVGVEVELTAKSDADTSHILNGLLARYTSVWYFVDTSTLVQARARRVVEKAVEALHTEKGRVQIIPLSALP